MVPPQQGQHNTKGWCHHNKVNTTQRDGATTTRPTQHKGMVRPQGQKNTKGRKDDHEVCLLVGCLTSQQQASVSQGQICSDNFMCCHTEIEVADQTFYLTQSQYTDTGPTSPSVDPLTPGAWQDSHWNANFLSHWYDSTPKKSRRKRDSNPGSSALEADALTTWPTRRSDHEGKANTT